MGMPRQACRGVGHVARPSAVLSVGETVIVDVLGVLVGVVVSVIGGCHVLLRQCWKVGLSGATDEMSFVHKRCPTSTKQACTYRWWRVRDCTGAAASTPRCIWCCCCWCCGGGGVAGWPTLGRWQCYTKHSKANGIDSLLDNLQGVHSVTLVTCLRHKSSLAANVRIDSVPGCPANVVVILGQAHLLPHFKFNCGKIRKEKVCAALARCALMVLLYRERLVGGIFEPLARPCNRVLVGE